MPGSKASVQWRIVKATVAGTKHESKGQPSDDSLAVQKRDDGTIFVAVADGAGGATYGGQGAAWATKESLDWLWQVVPIGQQDLHPTQLQTILVSALQRAHDAITYQSRSYTASQADSWQAPVSSDKSKLVATNGVNEADAVRGNADTKTYEHEADPSQQRTHKLKSVFGKKIRHNHPDTSPANDRHRFPSQSASIQLTRRDFDCTLLLAVITPLLAGFIQVGDGFIIGEMDDQLELLTVPYKGEFVNETTFVTSRSYVASASFKAMETNKLTGVALMSDGLEGILVRRETWNLFEKPLRQLFEFARRTDIENPSADAVLEAWLHRKEIIDKTDDDRTLIFIVPTSK